MIFKGIIHAHSNFSYDGQHSLEEIAKFAKKRGYSFVGMTEHSDTFDKDKMSDYVKKCRSVSDLEFILIPGIEFTCERNLHLLGLGIEHFTDSKDPISVAKFVKAQGGLAIVAHPSRYDYKIPVGLEGEINGIEVWNAGYDGRFFPNDCSLNLLKDFRSHSKKILAFGGQDLHQITDHSHVQLVVSYERLGKGEILDALKQGKFMISNPYLELDPRGEPGWLKLAQIIIGRRIYHLAKGIRDRLAWV